MRTNDITRWLRAGGIAFAVLALAASAVEVGREGRGAAAPIPAIAARDPLVAELQRCNTVTPTSGRDEACERAWAENRRRFLGASRQTSPVPAVPASQPATTGDRP